MLSTDAGGGSPQKETRGPEPRSALTRRRAITVGVGAAVGSVALPRAWFTSQPQFATSIDEGTWPMERHDPARTGYAPDQTGPSRDPVVTWQIALSDRFRTWPWLMGAGDTVYAAANSGLVAVDTESGTRQWRTNHPGTLDWSDESVFIGTAPILGGGSLLVGSGVNVYALDRAGGAAMWEYQTNSSLDATLRAGNTLFVSSLIGSGDRLVAIDVGSGLEHWRTSPDTGVQPSAYAGGYVVGPVVDQGGALGAVDAATGTREWIRADTSFANAYESQPSIANDTVFHGTEPVHALDLSDGTTRWIRSVGPPGTRVKPVTDGSSLYLAIPETGRVHALDVADGDDRWSVDVEGIARDGIPALVDGTLYVGLERGVAALDTDTGEERFRVNDLGAASAGTAPIVVANTLYVVVDGTLYALEDR